MLSFSILTFFLIISYSHPQIYLQNDMNDYVDMVMEVLNDSSESKPIGMLISTF